MKETRITDIFDRISELNIELDDDPIARGPKFLNNMVALCRNYTNEVQNFSRECHMHIRDVEHKLRIAKTDYELQFNDLMANDPEVRALRSHSKADREAVANTRLSALQEEINSLELSLSDLGHVNTVITSKLHEFRDVNRDIRLQMQIIQAEIKIGAMWGNDMEYDAPHISAKDITTLSDEAPEEVFENPNEDEEIKSKPELVVQALEAPEDYADLDFSEFLHNMN